MLPTLKHNDFVVCFGWKGKRYKVGDVVVVTHPEFKTIIKRIAQIHPTQGLLLAGDNAFSTAPERMGWIAPKQIIGKVVFTA